MTPGSAVGSVDGSAYAGMVPVRRPGATPPQPLLVAS
jgi:hypothetical protein